MAMAGATGVSGAEPASFNSGLAPGYLDRGGFYFDASLNISAVDQLSYYDHIADPNEKSELLTALALARDARLGSKSSIGFLSKLSIFHRSL